MDPWEEYLRQIEEMLNEQEQALLPKPKYTEEGYPYYTPEDRGEFNPPQFASEVTPPHVPELVNSDQWLAEEALPPLPEEIPLPRPRPQPSLAKNLAEAVMLGPELVRKVTEPYRQFVGRAMETTAEAPWSIASLLTSIPVAAEGLFGETKTPYLSELDDISRWLERQGKGASETIRTGIGRQKPTNLSEELAGLLGESVTPMGKATVPATLGLTAMRAAVRTPPEAVPSMPKELAELLLTPAEADMLDSVEEWKRRQQGTVQAQKTIMETDSLLKPPTKPRQRKKETNEDFARRVADYEEKRAQFYQTLTPTAERIIGATEQKVLLDTVGGPKYVKPSDYSGLSYLAAISAGMILGPRVLRTFKTNRTPQPMTFKNAVTLAPGVFGFRPPQSRLVKDAMPGTQAFTTPVDLARSADDINQVALGVGRKNGFTPQIANEIEETFRIQTRAGARHLTDSAIATGRMETPSFTFKAPVSLETMERTFTPQIKEYLILWDSAERLVEQSRLTKFKPTTANPNPGQPTILNGMTLSDVSLAIRTIEQANPNVKAAAKAWWDWNRNVRKFASDGEYATMTKGNLNANPAVPNPRSVAYMNAQHKYEVPWEGRREDLGMPLAQRLAEQDPIQMQSQYSRVALRERMENEARGKYIDAANRYIPGMFEKVANTPEEARAILSENPRFEKNTIKIYRRGIPEYYTADPLIVDSLKMDPYFMTNGVGQAIYATKRVLEFGATGLGAPFFAPTSLLRNWSIMKFTAGQGYRSPSLIGSIVAIPRQLYPQLARSIALSLEAGSGSKLSGFAGQGWADSLAQTLAKHYADSLYAQLQFVGTSRGSILEHARSVQALQRASQIMDKYAGPAKPFWNAYKSLIESVHNGPAFEYVRKNLSVEPLPQLASRARALTGDPRVTGQYYFRDPTTGKDVPIRYETGGRVSHTIGAAVVRPYLAATEWIGRDATPWFNPTQQGIKRIGQAYLKDPVKFTRNMYLYAVAPAAAQYMYAHALGTDPNGVRYVDYMLNRRSAYNRHMNWYVPIPGRPAEDGMEISYFHELAPVKRLAEVAMDHMYGNAQNSLAEDYWKTAHAFVDTAITPPLPPIAGGIMALTGTQPPMGLPLGPFGGEAYPIKSDPFDQTGGMPQSIEAFTRVLGGGLATTIGAGFAAFTNTEDGFFDALANAGKEAGKSMIARAPLVRDIAGIRFPMSGNTDIRRELFDKQKYVDQLLKFIKGWDTQFQIQTKAASPGGANVADKLLGPTVSTEPPGIVPPNPTNPLFVQFAKQVYERFKHESPNPVKGQDEGGVGFRSLWRRYGDATAALKTLRVNEGSHISWQRQLSNRPGVYKELTDAKIDPTNLREVKNYYVRKQQDAARVILYMIRAVEEDFSKQLGRKITIKDLDPYGKPSQQPAPFAYPGVVEDVNAAWGQ